MKKMTKTRNSPKANIRLIPVLFIILSSTPKSSDNTISLVHNNGEYPMPNLHNACIYNP